ncbi:hypothetical protein [Methylobacterium nodulans]|uniref:Uncharacterized protein n=1 Tax=Methylobacterium nodulans (strain LMG 21967 / CNCM I-2342 / ORS 2060) TaxID=460265 RepID=B8ICA9_METNO|nr:conserved hypothetical protein [Methylobacterium nodulans ORS 2060]
MKSSSILAAVTLLLAAPPAFSQGTAEQRAACTPDVWRLCASAIPNVGAITSCLRRESANLSPACRTVMNEVQGPAQRVESAQRVAPARPEAPQRMATRRQEPPRIAVHPAPVRRTLAARPAPRMMTPRQAPVRLTMRRHYARTAMVRHPAVHAATPRRHYAVRSPRRDYAGIPAGFARFGGSRSAMREANYWMRQISGMMGGMGGMGGMSLDSIRDMRVGDLMNMME